MAGVLIGVFFVSAAAILYQITLTRIFSIAEWYHYAFLVVSLALLGYGASGTVAARLERARRRPGLGWLGKLALGFSVTTIGSYLAANYIPFDSFRMALERRQVLLFLGEYLALSIPFFFAGMVLAVSFREMPGRPGIIYCASMIGAGAGAVVMPILAGRIPVEGLVLFAAGIGFLGTAALLKGRLAGAAMVIGLALFLFSLSIPRWMEVRSSEYKSLRLALLYPGAEVVERKESPSARVEIVKSAGLRYAPGLSYMYEGELPSQLGVAIDGGNMTAAVQGDDWGFGEYLPAAVAYVLAKPKSVLVLRPRGGLEVVTALANGEPRVVAVEDEPAVAAAVAHSWRHRPAKWVVGGLRSYLRSGEQEFDVVSMPLSEDMSVVKGGAFSLTQDYRLTVEGMEAALARVAAGGVLSITRWLQTPPSESLRALDAVAEALRQTGVAEPGKHIVAIRSWITMTILAKREPFSGDEIDLAKEFCEERRFDLVWCPGIGEEEVNRFAELPEPAYYLAAKELLGEGREGFLRGYEYDVRAVTDERPFFFHFFKWRQLPGLVRRFGKEWLPFGGSGYLFLLSAMGAALVGAGILLVIPAFGRGGLGRGGAGFLAYFAALGLGYILVEIALMHRFVLLLDKPTYAFAAVLATLLGASGLGSLVSEKYPPQDWRWATLATAVAVGALGLLGGTVAERGVGLGFGLRLGLVVVMVAPVGFLMGFPFPSGLKALAKKRPEAIAWAWAANGAVSVVGSVAAIMVALHGGYTWVLWAGAGAYVGAFFAWATLPCERGVRSEQRPGSST